MTEELKQYYNNLVFKDNAQTKYYFDIIGIMQGEDDTEINYPIITILQNRKAATGAETFKKAINQIEKNKSINTVLIREYNNFFDESEPINESRFILQKTKNKMKSRKKNETPTQPTEFSGLGAVDQVFKSFGNTLGFMGFQNGLSGIITASAQQIALQDKMETMKDDLINLKQEKNRLEGIIEGLKEKNEALKDEKKKVENDYIDLKRDFKYKEEEWSKKNSLGTLLATAGLGVLGKKMNLDATLSGLLNDEPQQPTPQQTNNENEDDLDGVQVSTVNPEIADYLEEINRYLNTLDRSRIKLVTIICQYLSLGDAKLKQIYKFVATQMEAKETQNNNPNTEQSKEQ